MRALKFSAPALLLVAFVLGLQADSNVRIVRLSLVTGAVQVKLPDGRGWRPALLNAPLVQGEQVRTLGSGRAEIQFENGSTLRLIPGSEVDFTRLALSDSGVFETTARVSSGTAFATLFKLDSKDFRITLPGDHWVEAKNDASLRINSAADAQPVQVLAGRAELDGGGQSLAMKKGDAAQFAGGGNARLTAISAPADPWTKWSEQRDQYYEAALHEGVQPGGLTQVVNWDANTMGPMPAYNGAGLNYVGAQACPWTVTAGQYSGWCWSSANGWFFPDQAPAINAQVAGSASDVSQTNSVLAGQNSPYNVMFYGGMYPSFSMGFGGIGMGGMMGMPMICGDMLCDAMFGGLYGPAYYPEAIPYFVAGGAAPFGNTIPVTRSRNTVKPTSPILRPPPAPHAVLPVNGRFGARSFANASAGFQGSRPSGVMLSHANFSTGYRAMPAMASGARFSGGSGARPAIMMSAPSMGASSGGFAHGASGGSMGGGMRSGGAGSGGGGSHGVVH